jgi:epoxide hydrolase-like predicted phosphatase
MTIRAVVFDIGGVLVDAPPMDFDVHWAPRIGLTLEEFEARADPIWRDGSIGAASLIQVHERLARALAVKMSTVEEMMEDMWVRYLGTLNADVFSYARGLRPRYRTGIISNSFVGARERERDAYGFEDLVDDIVYSHEVGLAKPDPLIYALACQRLEVEPDEVVFVDDKPDAVEGAQAYGMHAVLMRDGPQAIGDVEALLA